MRSIAEEHSLRGKFVLLRVDVNVPLKGKKIVDDSRLRAILPTIRLLEKRKAHIILVGHLGRPKAREESLSLKPIGYHLGKLLKKPVRVLSLARGAAEVRLAAASGLVFLENIRFEKGEDENSSLLAKKLASLADIYVNEAFSVSHRKAASMVGITKYLPAYAGLSLVDELRSLEQIKYKGKRPVIAIIGGAKVADKLAVIKYLLPKVDVVLTGGAVANTFMRAAGVEVGKSLVDEKVIAQAKAILLAARERLIVPHDVVVDNTKTLKHEHGWCLDSQVGQADRILDIGPQTARVYNSYLTGARTILWAGPLGMTEELKYAQASLVIGRTVSQRARAGAFVLIGGGETATFFHQQKLWVNHISLAGSALLEFLAGKKLPGIEALK